MERGFAETRIADVADRAGVSPALVIYYFKTKDQLLTEAIRYSEDSWYAEGQQRMAGIPTAAGKRGRGACLPPEHAFCRRTAGIRMDPVRSSRWQDGPARVRTSREPGPGQ